MKQTLLIILVIFMLPVFLSAQDVTRVKGTVKDKNGDPLPGANVLIPSLNVGAATDESGRFMFSVPAEQSRGQEVTLIARYVGYKQQSAKIRLSGEEIIKDFSLDEDIFQSEDVVVTGIASKTSKAVAEVAVSKVVASDLTEIQSYQTMSQLVAGKVSGVQMTPASGNVGGGFRFYMRSGGGLNGDEQPMIYVDGVRIDNAEIEGYGVGGQGNSMLSTLDPENIANIEVLKGPAGAAMYGTSGANGVILITTKSGKLAVGKSQSLSLDYKYAYGYNTQSYKYKNEDFMSANDANALFRDGVIRQHTLNVSGGSGLLRYYASFDDRFEDGIIPNNNLKRQALRANITAYTSPDISLKINSGYSYTDLSRPNNDNNILGFLGNTLLFPTSYQFTDSTSVYALKDASTIESFIGSAQLTYTPIKNLEFFVSAGVDNSNYRQDLTFPQNLAYPTVSNGQRSIFNRENKQFTYDFNGRYNYNIMSDLQATAIVGAQLFNRSFKTSYIQSEKFATELITNVGAGSDVTDYGEGFLNTREAGIFTEHSLVYQNQYFLTLGLREDFASSIGKEAPSILYPKLSGAVRLDKYDFFPSNLLSLFKVRAAYGESGQLPDPRDPISLLWEATAGGYGAGATVSQIGNIEIKPERIKEYEFGFEAEFLGNYSVEFTYYNQNATNSIIGREESPSTGLTASSIPYNIGGMKSWGIESLVQASPFRSLNYSLDIGMIWNYQTNEVTDLGGAQPIFDGFDVNVIKEGMPKHEFYTWQVLGAKFNTDGTYAGVNATADRVDFGNPIPNYTGSLSFNFRFLKNFYLYVMADWALNRKMYNETKLFAIRFGNNPRYNYLRAALDQTSASPDVARLTPGTQAYIDAANEYAKMNYNYDGNFIEDADFLKVREISLSYSFKDFLPDMYISNYVRDLIIGISARNVWTITNYSGADVELNFDGGRSLSRGQDFLTLQNPTVYNLWFRLAL